MGWVSAAACASSEGAGKMTFLHRALHKPKMCVPIWEGNQAKIPMQWTMSKKKQKKKEWVHSFYIKWLEYGKYFLNYAKEREIQ